MGLCGGTELMQAGELRIKLAVKPLPGALYVLHQGGKLIGKRDPRNEQAEREAAEWRWEIESSCRGKSIKISIKNQVFFTLNPMEF
jgi:hypothetical protein